MAHAPSVVGRVAHARRVSLSSFSFNNGVLTLAPAVWGNIANVLFGVIVSAHAHTHASASPLPR